jgi:hypothetical protein
MLVFYSLAHAHDSDISNSAFEICQRFICGKHESIKWLYDQIDREATLPWQGSVNLDLCSTMPTMRELQLEESSIATENSYSAIDSDEDTIHPLAADALTVMGDLQQGQGRLSLASESGCSATDSDSRCGDDSDDDTVLSAGSTSMIFPR